MWYVILCQDQLNSLQKRLKNRKAHRERLASLKNEGRLLIAGPFPNFDTSELGGYSGSMIVAEFNSLEDAKKWADSDPYVMSGVYKNFEVKPFIKVLP